MLCWFYSVKFTHCLALVVWSSNEFRVWSGFMGMNCVKFVASIGNLEERDDGLWEEWTKFWILQCIKR